MSLVFAFNLPMFILVSNGRDVWNKCTTQVYIYYLEPAADAKNRFLCFECKLYYFQLKNIALLTDLFWIEHRQKLRLVVITGMDILSPGQYNSIALFYIVFIAQLV